MCRYYENFQSFPARERAVRGNGFSLLSPISPSRAVVSLTLYDGAIPASATADIGPVKERAGIPGTAKEQHRTKGARPGFQQSRDLRGWNLCHLLLTRQMTQGPAVLAARIRFLKGCAVRMSPPEQKGSATAYARGTQIQDTVFKLGPEPGYYLVQDRSPTVFIRTIKIRARGLSAINCKQVRKWKIFTEKPSPP